jgi:hypothetical protein
MDGRGFYNACKFGHEGNIEKGIIRLSRLNLYILSFIFTQGSARVRAMGKGCTMRNDMNAHIGRYRLWIGHSLRRRTTAFAPACILEFGVLPTSGHYANLKQGKQGSCSLVVSRRDPLPDCTRPSGRFTQEAEVLFDTGG